MICQFCRKEYGTNGGLHGHIKKSHGISQADYYHMFCPRYDLSDNELICYKNYDQYFSSDFNSRETFLNWFMSNYTLPSTKDYCLKQLKDRGERKNTSRFPSHVELKSMMVPSMLGWEKMYYTLADFHEDISKHGFIVKYDYRATPYIDNIKQIKIYQDTREQTPLRFDSEVEIMKLPCGDYAPSSEYYSDVVVERKSLSDLVGTLTAGKERFYKEIEKAQTMGLYLVVLVEELYSEVLVYTSTNKFSKKVNGAHIFHEIRQICDLFENIQFLFSGNRKRSSDLVEKIFRMGNSVKSLDLEFLKDKGLI